MTRVDGRTLAAVAFLLASACHQDPAAAEADRTRRDQDALAEPVRRDRVLDDLLRNADHLAETGDEAAAVALLRGDATFAADQAVRSIDLVKPESAWGRKVTAELADVLHQRQALITPYAAALEGTDLDAKLTAVQGQLVLEEKTMAALAHASGELESWTPPALDAAVLEPIHLLTAPHPAAPDASAPTLTKAASSPHP